jgi:hypothetical protein
LFGGKKIDLVTPKFLDHQIKNRVLAEMEIYYEAEK